MAEELPDWAQDTPSDLPDWARDTTIADTSGSDPSAPHTEDALNEPLTYDTFGPTPQLPSAIRAKEYARNYQAAMDHISRSTMTGPEEMQTARDLVKNHPWAENAAVTAVQVAKGMMQPPNAQDILFQGAGGLFGPQAQNIYRGVQAYNEGKAPEDVARTLSPEYGHIQEMRENPIGSKEFFQGAIPLAVEGAQYLPVLGAALRLPPVRAKGPEFRFPVTEKPGGIAPVAAPVAGVPEPEPIVTNPVPEASKESQVQDLVSQGFSEQSARGVVNRQIREPGKPPEPLPTFEVDDIVDATEINNRIKDARQLDDGSWKVLLDNDQAALLHPVDAEGSQLRIAQIADRSTYEGRSIMTGEPIESIQAREQNNRFGLTDTEQSRLRLLREQRKIDMDRADKLEATDPVAADQMRQEAVRDYAKELRTIYKTEGGESDAVKSSNAQVESGGPALGEQEGAGGPLPEAGSGNNAIGESQRVEARGNVPGEQPEPTGETVAPEAPGENELFGQGLPKLEAFGHAPGPGERVIWRGKNLTVESVNPKSKVVSFVGGRKAPFTSRMKRPLPAFYEEAVGTVQRRLALPKDERTLRMGQEQGVYPKAKELRTLYDNEYEALNSKYGSGPPKRKVLASANKAAFAGGTPEQNAAIARGKREGAGPQSFHEGHQADQAAHMAAVTEGAQKVPGGKLIREPRTFTAAGDQFGNSVKSPVASYVTENGGIISKSAAKAKGKYERNAALWDGTPDFRKSPTHNKIWQPTGEMPDVMAANLHDAGLIKEPTVEAMYDALGKESRSARTVRQTEQAREKTTGTRETQAKNFGQAERSEKTQGTQAIPAADLDIGSKVVVDGTPLKVTAHNMNDMTLTLEDGSRFGIQKVNANDVIYGEIAEPGVLKDVAKESAKEGTKRGAEVVPPPVPREFLTPPPPPQVQARMGSSIEKVFNDLHGSGVITESDPIKGLGKTEVIDAGRAAIKAGVDPEAAARSDFLRPDYKYAVMRARAEDLRLAAIEAERKAKLEPTIENKADAENAFREYSNWNARTVEAGNAADGWLAAKGAIDPITDEPDLNTMVDAREQFIRANKREMTPSEMKQAKKQVLNVQKTALERNAAAEKYSEQLRKAAPEMHDEIKDKADLERVTDKIWDRKFPCS